MEIQSTQVCISLKSLFSRHKGIGVQFTDEPTGALDSASAKQLLSMLAELNEQDRSTILMVTHDPFSASFGNRVLFIKDGNLKKEIDKGQHNRNDFYQTILSEISAFGGE